MQLAMSASRLQPPSLPVSEAGEIVAHDMWQISGRSNFIGCRLLMPSVALVLEEFHIWDISTVTFVAMCKKMADVALMNIVQYILNRFVHDTGISCCDRSVEDTDPAGIKPNDCFKIL